MEMIFKFLEENFNTIFIAIFAYVAVSFFIRGRKAGKKFNVAELKNIVFHEKGVSGYSNKSFITKMGGASRVLDVIVADNQLWVKGIWGVFTDIGEYYDLTHKVPLSNIVNIDINGRKVDLWFVNKEGKESHITLVLKNAEEMVNAIRA